MINCIVLKWLGDFNIARNPFIITKSLCSAIDAMSLTRIKEQPSYVIIICLVYKYFKILIEVNMAVKGILTLVWLKAVI